MEQYWEWLCSIPGLYRMQQEILLRCFRNPEGVWRSSGRELSRLADRGYTWAARVRRFQEETDRSRSQRTAFQPACAARWATTISDVS